MDKRSQYIFLGYLFMVVFFLVHFTEIFGNPVVIKFMLLVLSATFLISGYAIKKEDRPKGS